MSAERPTPAAAPPAAHVHGEQCTVCGRVPGPAREYKIGDRFLDVLFLGVCTAMDLTATRASNRRHAALIVRAPDAATHDRLWARFQELLPAYEAQLVAVSSSYLREHCGAEVRRAPR